MQDFFTRQVAPTPPQIRARRGGGGGRTIDKFVGARLRARRLALGLGKAELGRGIRMPASLIEAYERGESRVQPAHLLAFSDLLGVKLIFFFEGAN